MDAQAKKRAAFRAKLNAQKQEKQRIDSPLVRYNEHDQPVCRVCNVAIKNESLWPAHQASRKHHEAVDKLKATASAVNRPNNAKPEPQKELPKPKPDSSKVLPNKSETSTSLPKHQSSTLPPDFFDNSVAKRKKTEKNPEKLGSLDSDNQDYVSSRNQAAPAVVSGSGTGSASSAGPVETSIPESKASNGLRQVSKIPAGMDSNQVKGALPQGFFDDKDADLRARGITPVKPDVKDEYKEFEKLIQEDLQEVDDRLEEEEVDAAEMIEEAETVEQRSYRERVEMLRKKKLELRASRSASGTKDVEATRKQPSHEDSSSSEDENDETFTIDWRAKHI